MPLPLANGTRVRWTDEWKRARPRKLGTVIGQGRGSLGPWDVYLVAPDDGVGKTVALPNGEVRQAIELHPDRVEVVA
jgi:hypothetical protein